MAEPPAGLWLPSTSSLECSLNISTILPFKARYLVLIGTLSLDADSLSMDVLTLPSLDDAKHVEVVRVNNHFHASRESAAREGG